MSTSYFDRLLKRYLSGKASAEEKARLEAWLDLNKTGMPVGEELSPEEEDRLLLKIMNAPVEVPGVLPLTKPASRTKSWSWVAAACLLLLLAASASLWQWNRAGHDMLEVVAGSEHQKVILPDGSLVWLQAGSQLQYELRSSGASEGRYASLVGEALFEVAKDAGRPFEVHCGDVKLRVLGTSFHLKAAGQSLELKVLTGKVSLSAEGDGTSVEVMPNEKVVYSAGKGIEKQLLLAAEVATVTAGLEYNMQFKRSTLASVAKALGAKFNKSISIDRESAGACHLTIDLTDMSLENSLQLISEVLEISYSQSNNTIILSGYGCRGG